jgi:hypothetical protein
VILGHLAREIPLTLEQGSDVALKLNQFARYGFGGARAQKTSAKGASQNGGAKNGNVADTHANPPGSSHKLP